MRTEDHGRRALLHESLRVYRRFARPILIVERDETRDREDERRDAIGIDADERRARTILRDGLDRRTDERALEEPIERDHHRARRADHDELLCVAVSPKIRTTLSYGVGSTRKSDPQIARATASRKKSNPIAAMIALTGGASRSGRNTTRSSAAPSAARTEIALAVYFGGGVGRPTGGVNSSPPHEPMV